MIHVLLFGIYHKIQVHQLSLKCNAVSAVIVKNECSLWGGGCRDFVRGTVGTRLFLEICRRKCIDLNLREEIHIYRRSLGGKQGTCTLQSPHL